MDYLLNLLWRPLLGLFLVWHLHLLYVNLGTMMSSLLMLSCFLFLLFVVDRLWLRLYMLVMRLVVVVIKRFVVSHRLIISYGLHVPDLLNITWRLVNQRFW